MFLQNHSYIETPHLLNCNFTFRYVKFSTLCCANAVLMLGLASASRTAWLSRERSGFGFKILALVATNAAGDVSTCFMSSIHSLSRPVKIKAQNRMSGFYRHNGTRNIKMPSRSGLVTCNSTTVLSTSWYENKVIICTYNLFLFILYFSRNIPTDTQQHKQLKLSSIVSYETHGCEYQRFAEILTSIIFSWRPASFFTDLASVPKSIRTCRRKNRERFA